MKLLNMKIRLDVERFLPPIFNTVEKLIRVRLAGQPIRYREAADGDGVDATIVYMHTVRQERDGRCCRFYIIAYTHVPGEAPPRGPVRVYVMEYPLITLSARDGALEYTAPEMGNP